MAIQNQFVVPQFIDVEDKIFGPITVRQFVILLIGGIACFIAFKLADITLFIFFLATIGGSSLVLAFVKINGQPFHYFLLNIFQTARKPSLRIWNKFYTKADLKRFQDEAQTIVIVPEKPLKHLSYSRIRDLSLTVNTGGYFKADD